MNHRHRKILHAIFAHPINANIAMRDVESVLVEMGAEVSDAKKSKMHVKMKDHSVNFEAAHHSLSKQQVVQVRKFIEACGIDPVADYPL